MENNDPKPETGAQPNDDVMDSELDNLTRQLAETEAKLAEMRDTVLRERAELDNQRKRLQRELEQARKFANEKLLAELLPVLDNLERGLALEGADYAGLRGGVELTLRELVRVAETGGLKAVGAVGDVFDPEHHQAMAMVEDGSQGSGRLVTVMQKGYLLNERLLRPALVSVSK